MAELQITIPYKTIPARVVFIAMLSLLPAWSVVAPAMIGLCVGWAMSGYGSVPAWATWHTCVSLLAFTLLAILVTAVSEDNRIHVSKDGMAFPPLLLPRLRFRRNRGWQELSEAHVQPPDDNNPGWLFLRFNDEPMLPLKLARLSKSDLEQLFMAIELWAINCKRTAELVDYQKQIQNAGREVGAAGYTQMWEEELSRRFTATAFMPLEPGQELGGGKLKIVRQLAFGGLSAIYLAQDNELDLVVLKEAVVPPNADDQARRQAEQLLVREADLLSRLEHPRIARVLDHFIEDGRDYLKLEYINGQDLRQHVKQNGPITQTTALEWGKQILDILSFLHDQQPAVIHRDLTPDNLVLTRTGEIVLIDFGAANVFVGNATGTIVGKQAYIPAEQLRGKATTVSDLYAFGGTLYYLLTGKDPLPLSEARPRQINTEIDQWLDDIVAKATAFEPDDRYQSAKEILAALVAASNNIGIFTEVNR